jgi:hypothetical protein
MELDELKQTWKQTPIHKPLNTDIMELIQHKAYGPLNALKKSFSKQMWLMMLMPFFLFFTNFDDPYKALTSIMFWAYVLLCVGMVIFAWFNYQLVDKMETMDGNVKQNLGQQVDILETRLKWHTKGMQIALVIFIVLTEVLPYFQHYRMLDKWHSLSAWIRFSSYAGLLLLQHFTSRYALHRKFGQHLAYLKGLVKELQ